MKNIKALTFHNAYNYGALLQAYALQKKIKDLGYNYEIIDFQDYELINFYNPTYIRAKRFKSKLKKIIKILIYYIPEKKRYSSFKSFVEKELLLTKKIDSIGKIGNILNKNDVLLTGSDQVWNMEIVKQYFDLYSLNFETNAKKISYAASIGDISLIKNNKEKYKDNLSKLNNISVREEDAKKELEKLLNKNVETVLDPTLLLTRDDWNQKISNCKVPTEKYILAYVVKKDDEYIKIVNELSDKTGLKVIHFGLKNPGYKNVLKSEYTCGPWEFINLIKNAEYVVATSFHATAFSIIFNKKFFIVPHRKTGTRVTSLLDKLEIKNRSFNSLDEFKKIDYNFETNWEQINKKLEKEREKSINWLINAIEK